MILPRRFEFATSPGWMRRRLEPELLDAESVAEADLVKAYRELEALHYWLGNTSAVMRRLRPCFAEGRDQVLRVLDVGCGHGALLAEIRRRFSNRVEVVGMDLRPAPAQSPVTILTGNVVTDELPRSDVAVCVVMAHHLSESEVATLIQNVARSCDHLILLDLVRNPVPLALFRFFVRPWLCRINGLDGEASIWRSYTAREMADIVTKAVAQGPRPVQAIRHSVAPFWIRQVVEINWESPLDRPI